MSPTLSNFAKIASRSSKSEFNFFASLTLPRYRRVRKNQTLRAQRIRATRNLVSEDVKGRTALDSVENSPWLCAAVRRS